MLLEFWAGSLPTEAVHLVEIIIARSKICSQGLRFLHASPTGACSIKTPLLEAWAGIEPAHGSFADFSVTTSPPGH